MFEILEEERELKEGSREFPKGGAKGEVAWNEVSFQYIPARPS